MQTRLENPIINSAYAEPTQHHEFDDTGRPTGNLLPGRRKSEYFIPIPPPKSGKAAEDAAVQLIEVLDPWDCLAAMTSAIEALDGGH